MPNILIIACDFFAETIQSFFAGHFVQWDIWVICLIVVLKLAVTVFISLYFQIFWPKWLNFCRSFQKILVYDRKKTDHKPYLRTLSNSNRSLCACTAMKCSLDWICSVRARFIISLTWAFFCISACSFLLHSLSACSWTQRSGHQQNAKRKPGGAWCIETTSQWFAWNNIKLLKASES